MTKLSTHLEQQINNQMNNEFYNQRFYLLLSAYFDMQVLPNIAGFMRNQASGEYFHAMKFKDYLIDRFASPNLEGLEDIPGFPKAATQAFENAMKLEEGTTRNIWSLYDIAEGEKDRATQVFLQWYITEQIEEEKTINDWLLLIQKNDTPQGLLEINEMMGENENIPSKAY